MARGTGALVAASFLVGHAIVEGGSALRSARATESPLQRDCDEELGGVAAEMVGIWHEFESDAVVLRHTGASACAISEGTAPSRFTIVAGKGDMICSSQVLKPELALVRGRVTSEDLAYQVEEFQVDAGMPGGGSTRNVASAWPEVCAAAKPCPLVVFLHGAGEHGTDPGLLKDWGLLNYYSADADCRKSLASVIVMPQIAEEEDWASDGPAIFQHFVMPLVNDLLQKNDKLDNDRVALAGYSEGGVGAAIGASLYPDVFSVLAAGSPTMPLRSWHDAEANLRLPPVGGASVKPRLRHIAFAYSDQDIFDTGLSLRKIMGALEGNGLLENSAVNVQLYTGIPHMAASEAFFNHWRYLHDILWLGVFNGQPS